MLPSINGNLADITNPSEKIADTESKGLLNWVSKLCRKGYNDLFGDDGIITVMVPRIFRRSEKEPVECCCRLPSKNDEPTTGKDAREIEIKEEKKFKDNKCVRMVREGLTTAEICVLGFGYLCGLFSAKLCKEIVAVTVAPVVHGAAVGCKKVAECFGCYRSNQKPPK